MKTKNELSNERLKRMFPVWWQQEQKRQRYVREMFGDTKKAEK